MVKLIIYLFLIGIKFCSMSDEFFSNSTLYLVNSNDLPSEDSLQDQSFKEIFKSHKIESFILRIKNKNFKSVENQLSIKIYKDFYQISACFDEDLKEYTSHIFKTPFYSKLTINHTNKFEGTKKDCYYRYDFLEGESHRTDEHSNFFLISELLSDIEKKNKGSPYKGEINKLMSVCNFDFNIILDKINFFMSKFSIFERSNEFLEVNFVFNEKSLNFDFTEIFFYFSSSESKNKDLYYLSLSDNANTKIFKSYSIYFKKTNKLVTYNRDEHTFSIKDYRDKKINMILSTLNKTSLFNNEVKLKIDFNSHFSNFNPKNSDQLTCFLVYQPLNEDTFVEKNEVNKFLSHLKEYNPYFSPFIDQELSSEFGSQYQFFFTFCENSQKLKKDNQIEINYPFHFRYQPPSYLYSHKNASLPLPIIKMISSKRLIEDKLDIKQFVYEEILSSSSIINTYEFFSQKSGEINYFNQFNQNRLCLYHFIPVGNSNYAMVVSIITVVISFIGFFMLFFEIVFKKLEIESEIKQD